MDRVEVIMKNLKCTREEALQVIADDKAVDHKKPMPFDLPPEKAKIARQYARCGTRKTTTTTPKKREDPEKEAIIEDLYTFLVQNGYENVQIANKTRMITLENEGKKYDLTLIAKRKGD